MSTIPGYENRPMIRAIRLEENETITVNGRLDEAAWKRAIPATDFVQQDPHYGQAATERTEVRVLFNRKSLFLGVICFDSKPKKLKRNQMLRDGSFVSDDRFAWTIDPLLNGVNGYFFETNPNGAMSDSLIIGAASSFNDNSVPGWDGIWYERVRRSEIGWTIEIEIPFQTLAFNSHAPAWGINFQRTLQRNNEDSLWNGWGRNQNLQQMTSAGLLEGISGVTQGHAISVQPYIIGKFGQAPPRLNPPGSVIEPNFRGTGGGDITYSITPQLKANLTVNTDFAETEVDQRQVNLTQFPLFFPEKRTFFLEGSNFLSFSREPDNVIMPYFSRDIGLNPDGTTQRINFGAKLTGQMGAYDLGFLQVQTANSEENAGENFTVFRARRRFLKQSYVGGIFTRRSDRSGVIPDRYTGGADFSLATSTFRGNQNLEFSGFYLRNTDLTGTAGNAAYGVRLEYPNDRWTARLSFREIQAGWNPALGFIQRTDVRHYNPLLQFAPRPRNSRFIRRFVYNASLDFYTDLHNVARTRDLDMQVFGIDFQTGDAFGLHAAQVYESPSADFEISKGITLPMNSRYNFTRGYVTVQTANRRMLALNSNYSTGNFYSGTRKELFASLSIRAHPGLVVTTDYDWNRVELTQGNFTTTLFRVAINTQLNPFISLGNTIQYDNVTRGLGWQSRFRWTVRPGNDMFIVYTQNWLSEPIQGIQTLNRSAAAKVVYTHQF